MSLNVLHLSAGNLFGGVETFLRTLGQTGGASGIVSEFAFCFDDKPAEALRATGAAVHLLPEARFRHPWTVVQTRRAARRLIRERRPDVVVCHSFWPQAVFAPAVRRAGTPLVFWTHDTPRGVHWLERMAGRNPPDLAIANSRFTMGKLPTIFPDSVPREVIRYPVEPPAPVASTARAEVRRELQTAEDSVVIVQSCRMDAWKGHPQLIAALGRIRGRDGWTAWFAGGAQRPAERAYVAELRAQAEAAGVLDRIRWLGQRSDVPRLLAAADVHCQANRDPEPFGIAFVEALDAALPVVTMRMGGAAEIVDESCGVLVDPGDVPALADALAALIDDPARRAGLGAAGPARARALCDPATVLGTLRRRLDDLILQSSAPSAPSGVLHQTCEPSRHHDP